MIKLAISDCALWQKKLFCAARDYNVVFTIDLATGELELFGTVPGCKMLDWSVGGLKILGDKLIISTIGSEHNWIVDLINDRWTGIHKGTESYETNPGFLLAYGYKDRLYMIGGSYEAILRVELDKYSINRITQPYKDCVSRGNHREDGFFKQGCVRGSTVFLPSMRDNYILKFDMENDKYEWIRIGSSNNRYSGIVFDGSCFWLSPRLNSRIVKWNEREYEEYDLPKGFELSKVYFRGIGLWEDKIILPNCYDKRSIIIDRNSQIEILEEEFAYYNNVNSDLTVSQTANGLIRISGGEDCKEILPAFEEKDLNAFFAKNSVEKSPAKDMYFEDRFCGLEYYVSFAI